MSLTDEVITIAASGQVITFKDIRYAKMLLIDKYHSRIIVGPKELADRYTHEGLMDVVIRIIQKDAAEYVIAKNYTNRYRLAEYIWPMLVAHGRMTTKLAFHKGAVNPKLPTFETYYSDYTLGKDPIKDLLYQKMPPQSRMIVDMIIEKLTPLGKSGVTRHQFYKWINEHDFKTRQTNERIWEYYKKKLIANGFIEIYKPK